MVFRSAPAEAPRHADGSAPVAHAPATPTPTHAAATTGEDALAWAQRVWDDREAWLSARGGVESVFMAAQLLGCREDAVAWLRQRTRL